MNYPQLKELLETPDYSSLTAEAAAAKVKTDAKHLLDFSTHVLSRKEVKSWLMEIGKLTPILTGTGQLEKQFAFILTDPDYSEIPVFDTLAQSLFDAAVGANLFTQTQREQIEDKARTYEPVTAKDIRIARLLDRAQTEQSELGTMREAVSQKEYRVAQLAQGIDPDEEEEA